MLKKIWSIIVGLIRFFFFWFVYLLNDMHDGLRAPFSISTQRSLTKNCPLIGYSMSFMIFHKIWFEMLRADYQAFYTRVFH